MKLFPLSAISLVMMGAPLVAHANDTPPTAPANLSAEFYSGAGAEIFWDRSSDDQTVIGYDITINGRSIGIQDVLSFYDSSIAEGTELTVTVVAVDNANQRSDVSSIFVSDGSSSVTDSSDSVDPSNDVVFADEADLLAALSIVRYSPTAAELFWDRAATPGLRYEISRDDESLGVTDGTSFFDGNLSVDEPFHNYFVKAFDSSNNQIASRLIVLNAGASTGNIFNGFPLTPSMPPVGGEDANNNDSDNSVQDPPLGVGVDNDTALTGLTITRYSPTAAELFWDRSATAGLRYEVSRDDELLGLTDGTSFFDGNLSVDEPFHNYFVRAIDVNNNVIDSELIVLNAGASTGGIPSRPDRFPPDTPIQPVEGEDVNNDDEQIVSEPPSTQPTVSGDIETLLTSVGSGSPLSVENSRAFLDAFFLIANADPVQVIQNRFIGVYREALDAQNGVAGSRFVAESTSDTASTFACPEGGSYTFGPIEPDNTEHAFNQCQFDGVSLDGDMFLSLERFIDTAAPEFIAQGEFEGRLLTYTDEEGVTYELDEFFYYEDSGTDLLGRFIWDGAFTIRSGDRTLTVGDDEGALGTIVEGKNTLTDANAIPPYSSFRTNFSVTGTLTNGRTIDVSTLSDFRRFGQTENYTVGLLSVREEGVGSLSITADAALPDAFTVRVDTNGEVDQYNQDWTDSLDFIKREVPAQAE